jgi:nucleoside-diphosphate-sugar epimerase
MSRPTVLTTGGTGRIGPRVVRALQDRGYEVVNVSRSGSGDVADVTITADVTDAGETYGALATADADAVVHLGMRSSPVGAPGYVTFESNALSSYHVLEAAGALGIETVCLASSLSALGAGFEPDPVDVEYLPVDEQHPLSPSTPYGLGKQALEVTADGFARRADGPGTIASLRFAWVTDEATLREAVLEPDRSLAGVREAGSLHEERNTLFSYVHVDDAAEFVCRAVEADFEGHERFFVSGPDTTLETPTEAVIADLFPDVERRTAFEGHESLLDTAKADRLLGWSPSRSWRALRR